MYVEVCLSLLILKKNTFNFYLYKSYALNVFSKFITFTKIKHNARGSVVTHRTLSPVVVGSSSVRVKYFLSFHAVI
jgi:hypothetical protein